MKLGMRSFKLWTRPPLKDIRDYSPEERARRQLEFMPVARRANVVSSILLGSLAVMAAAAGYTALTGSRTSVGFWGFVVAGVVFLLSFALMPITLCPACNFELGGRKLSTYCPECGGLLRGKWDCDSCAKQFRPHGKGRGHTVRYCTRCGVLLHDKGI
jgi:hypothetical protein